MERARGQASRGWRGARATAPGWPQLPALRTGSLGKQGALVHWVPAVTAWLGISLLRVTGCVVPSALPYMSWGGCAWLEATLRCRAGGSRRGRSRLTLLSP